jgi:hypothetical protein
VAGRVWVARGSRRMIMTSRCGLRCGQSGSRRRGRDRAWARVLATAPRCVPGRVMMAIGHRARCEARAGRATRVMTRDTRAAMLAGVARLARA